MEKDTTTPPVSTAGCLVSGGCLLLGLAMVCATILTTIYLIVG